ncbi:hypothetical protein [Pseudomonas germanica]|uniref:Uncharacterized protein n=1 Tax=Pseudomonas germanica TaxID=2815720 RepID=A0ABX8YXG6_9PSED|nr:hypothetical protein [Pseudomonas germanica]QYY84037.1 hypothetical protein J0G10_11535 [Pseudomonas germanica]
MATKARFFKVIVRDGNGSHISFEAAHSEADLRNSITPLLSPYQNLESIQHLGFRLVDTNPDEENDAVEFSVQMKSGGRWYCRKDDFSYPHLLQQFAKNVQNINDFYEERDAERYME